MFVSSLVLKVSTTVVRKVRTLYCILRGMSGFIFGKLKERSDTADVRACARILILCCFELIYPQLIALSSSFVLRMSWRHL